MRGSPLPGCQHSFVRDVLRDPRFAAATIPPSADPAFQLLRRWMIRLDGDRHRRVREAFGGLFTARRVGQYRAVIAERAAVHHEADTFITIYTAIDPLRSDNGAVALNGFFGCPLTAVAS